MALCMILRDSSSLVSHVVSAAPFVSFFKMAGSGLDQLRRTFVHSLFCKAGRKTTCIYSLAKYYSPPSSREEPNGFCRYIATSNVTLLAASYSYCDIY